MNGPGSTLQQLDQWRSSRLPWYAKALDRLTSPVFQLFNWIYSSRYNPLYRSGALAVWLLLLVIISGVYLLFFYQVGNPYHSVARIQEQVWTGRWIRAFHRYASGAALVTVIFHIIQLLVQGRSWGPRLLAWISGVILTGAIMFSAWSGYVMVWDTHGQLVATSGARLLQLIPFLRDTLAQAFDGSSPVAPSFFFMNLFLHVAIPLGMVILLWIHTAKLARSSWLPEKWSSWHTVAAFFILALLWPAPLPPEANLLKIIGETPTDLFFGFWIPLVESRPLVLVGFAIFGLVFLTSIPWWWRPSQNPRTSDVDVERCDGCQQCVRDCPFQAIKMIVKPGQKLGIAEVDPSACVSCGVCGASCHSYAIGLPELKGSDQIAMLEVVCAQSKLVAGRNVALIYCASNSNSKGFIEKLSLELPAVHAIPLFCCGTLHMDVVETMLKRFDGVFVWGCPERCCHSRDGAVLMRERISHRRSPSLPRSVPVEKVAHWNGAVSEVAQFRRELAHFIASLEGGAKVEPLAARYWVSSIIVSSIFLALTALMSQWPIGSDPTDGLLRVAFRLPGRALEHCREPNQEEQRSIPAHMRLKQICEPRLIEYELKIAINGEPRIRTLLKHGGARGDRPVTANEEISLAPGIYQIKVELLPLDPELLVQRSIVLDSRIAVDPGKIILITQRDNSRFIEVQPIAIPIKNVLNRP